MDKFWLKQYPPGTPAEISPGTFGSLKELIESSLRRHADRTAYVHMGRRMSYAELDRRSASFAAWLQQRAGMQPGERIAIMLPNLLQYPVLMFGALRAGLTVVNTNPLYTTPELEHQLRDSGASAIVVLENFAATVQRATASLPMRHVIVTGVGDLLGFPKGPLVNFALRHVQKRVPSWSIPHARRLTAVMKEASGLTLTPVDISRDDIAFLQYTGGTTGVAKGAMLTHGNLVANVQQCYAWFKQVELDYVTYVCALPLYHIFSLTTNCLLFTMVGGAGLLITNPRDFAAFVKDLKANPPMFFMGVNTLFNALLNTPGFADVDFRQLAATLGGGMAVQRAVAERWKATTGCKITQGWGLTETSPVSCANPLVGKFAEFNGSVGVPLPSTEVSIRDEQGTEVGIGSSGELCVRGPQVMRGYWQRPAETANVMLPDGWLRTGDIGHFDEHGFVFLEDRKKDMIVVSGFKVYPSEVEDVVARHPGVREVAAVAQPDEHSGEAVALFVVRKDPALTAEELMQHCHQNLTGYKLPKSIHFREELPKTNVGKILRRSLREELERAN